MSNIEERLQFLEDRAALEDVLTDFWAAADSLSDVDGTLDCYTEDAVIDMTALNYPVLEGREDIRKEVSATIRDYSHLAHFGSNFRVLRLEGDEADCRANVLAIARSGSGEESRNHVEYEISYRRTPEGWKIRSLVERKLIG